MYMKRTYRKRWLQQPLGPSVLLMGLSVPGCFPTDSNCQEVRHCYPDLVDAGVDSGSEDAADSSVSDRRDGDHGDAGDSEASGDGSDGVGEGDVGIDVNHCESTKLPGEDPCVNVEQFGVFVSSNVP